MNTMILFETTESVIEVLWDIVLAIYILRVAFVYFLLNFLSGLALSYLAYSQLTPVTHLTTPQSELVLVPFLLFSSAIWARVLISYYEVPKVSGFRLAAGVTALVFMVVAEMITALVLYERGMSGWIWETDRWAGGAFGGLLVAYTLMMVVQMGFEGAEGGGVERGAAGSSHGHEGKSIVDAVPTVSVAERRKTKKTQ